MARKEKKRNGKKKKDQEEQNKQKKKRSRRMGCLSEKTAPLYIWNKETTSSWLDGWAYKKKWDHLYFTWAQL
jgi:hypothetical protein